MVESPPTRKTPARKPPARVISPETAAFVPRFEYGHMAGIAVVTGAGQGTRLGSGFVRFDRARIPWTVRYDEVIVVLEGELTVRTQHGDLTAGPRECIWLPNGTVLTYLSENALVFFAIEPADWAKEDQ